RVEPEDLGECVARKPVLLAPARRADDIVDAAASGAAEEPDAHGRFLAGPDAKRLGTRRAGPRDASTYFEVRYLTTNGFTPVTASLGRRVNPLAFLRSTEARRDRGRPLLRLPARAAGGCGRRRREHTDRSHHGDGDPDSTNPLELHAVTALVSLAR